MIISIIYVLNTIVNNYNIGYKYFFILNGGNESP